MKRPFVFLPLLIVVGSVGVPSVGAEEPPAPKPKAKPVPLNKQETVLLDVPNKTVIVKSQVVLREGVLEMLLCRKHTKEHESILAVDSLAYVIHTGLLAVGAEPGEPMLYRDGKYTPPRGQKLKIVVKWKDEKNQPREMEAKKWIRSATRRYFIETLDTLPASVKIPPDSELRYDQKHKELAWFGPMTENQRDHWLAQSDDKPYQKSVQSIYKRTQPREMKADWIFTGSRFFVEPEGPDKGKKYYQAEGGDVICVANFPTAMIDVNEESSASGEDNLLYEAWTERIPPLETPVTVEISPIVEQKKP